MPVDPNQLFDDAGRLNTPPQHQPAQGLQESRIQFGRLLATLPPAERFRAMAALMHDASEGDWGPQINPQLLTELEKTRTALQSEVAELRFQLSEAEARREKAERQLETERHDNQRLDALLAEQKRQLQAAKSLLQERESRIVEFQNRLGMLEASSASRDHSNQARERELQELRDRNMHLQSKLNESQEQIGRVERYYQQQCAEKDQLIQQIRAEAVAATPRAAAAVAHAENGVIPARLWERLQASSLPLELERVQPDLQIALRVVDALEMLAGSATTLNSHLAVVVSKYLPDFPAEMRDEWRKYDERPLPSEVARALVPSTGHPRVLRTKLRRLEDWHRAVVIGHDAAFQPSAIALELSRHLKSTDQKWSEKVPIRDYLRANGPQHFADTLRVLCAGKVAAAYQNPAEGE